MLDLNYDKYNKTIPYPKKNDFIIVYGYSKGKLVFTKLKSAITAEDKKNVASMEEDFDEKYWKEATSKYNKAQNDIYNSFKEDIFEAYEVSNNPKREKCFSLAWEHGHSAGYREVENYFSDFVELIY